jgi:hypothetical protein
MVQKSKGMKSAALSIGLAISGTGLEDATELINALNLSLDKVAYILSIVSAIYSIYKAKTNKK